MSYAAGRSLYQQIESSPLAYLKELNTTPAIPEYPTYIGIKKNTVDLLFGSKATGLEVNANKTKYMVMSRDHNAGRSHSMKVDTSFFGKVEEFKYLGTIITNQNSIQEEIKSRVKSGKACYHSMQNLLSSS